MTATIVLLLAVGGASIALVLPSVSERNEYPGLDSYRANQKIEQVAAAGGYERPLVPVVTLAGDTTVDSPGVRAALGAAFDRAAALADGRSVSYADAGDPGFVGADGRVTFGLVYPPTAEVGGLPGSALGEGALIHEALTSAMAAELPPGSRVQVTGLDSLATGTDAGGLNVPIKLAITIVAALAVLLWIFRSSLALVPLLVAFVAVPISFLGLLVVSPFVTIHETTVIMLPLFGIGIAIDYALILVTRWREERARGNDDAEAVHRAMGTAGHAVVFSSLAVAFGLVTMLVLPIPLLRSLGIGGMLVTASSALVTLVLLPVLLERYGRRLRRRQGLDEREEAASRTWTGWARLAVRFRRPAALVTAAFLGGLCLVATTINLNVPTTDHLRTSGPGHDALLTLDRAGVPRGVLTSFEVYVPPGQNTATVADSITDLADIHAVAASPADPSLLTVLPVHEGGDPAGRVTISQVVAAVPDDVLVGGNITQQVEYLDATYAMIPWMLALVALVTFVVLARAFRSLLIPIKAIVLNLLSLGAVLGAMVVLWQWGWGTEALLGIRPDGSIGSFVPVTIFAFLYGLSMDYEVFILSRMREEYDRTGSTGRAVINGVGRTGRLVTAAALILFFSFASMAMGGELDVSVFATGLALGILIDATLIRSVLVPATVAMMGRWNWWLPAWAARILRVPPSPLAPDRP
ncbi:MMPL family transporter [Cryptosporangium aurantiacum]|uniref:Putative drug exporter of the RND superfamily n=1 Tax=Cryptosporangium aurantiacum TaxID=134849 RepID=A0A1M7PAL3_9ACTN|nr:MMPL family transporter [Cryptosporangium aurantiacum]SHN13827.1 putative drug exporter of the RND superfamily [Cryptosporangium aurantiacum]